MNFLVDEQYSNCRDAIAYADAVVFGEISACELVVQACIRFYRDTRNTEFVLDFAVAERAMRIVQLLPHVKGAEAGKTITLSGWQKFILLNIFGWLVKETKTRRFRKVYTEVPRGNGKSTLVAPVALYMLTGDRESGAEVYSAAVTRDQARIVFGIASQMVQRCPEFRKASGVLALQRSIAHDPSGGRFEPLSADARSLDGLNVHFVVCDELAQHKQREVYDVLETAMGKREQSLLWSITTAGPDQGGIGFEIHDYAMKVLTGAITDDSFFAMIFTIDAGDDWTQESTWRKANPNWGVSVQPSYIKQLCDKARQVAGAQNAFKMKHLNVWTNASSGWMPLDIWARQATELTLADFEGEECEIGLDLASKVDIASKVRLFRRFRDDGLPVYYLFSDNYLPKAAALAGRNANYIGWSQDGSLNVTPGDVTDFSLIEEELEADVKRFNVQSIPYDPWQATKFAQDMQRRGVTTMVVYNNTVPNFSEPMKEFELLVRDGRLFHDNNPCFNWMISNVVYELDRKENIFPRKEREQNKIDGPVAAIMALGRWILTEYNEAEGAISAYEAEFKEHGSLVV